MRHEELYEESLRLKDLVATYKKSSDYNNLEETILELIEVYGSLNYCEEDEYLEEIIDLYKELTEVYIFKKSISCDMS